MQVATIASVALALGLSHAPGAFGQSSRLEMTKEASVVANCMMASLGLEATYMYIMNGNLTAAQDEIVRTHRISAAHAGQVLPTLVEDVTNSKPRVTSDVIKMVGVRFERCIAKLGLTPEQGRGSTCYSYSHVVRLVFKRKGEGAMDLAPHLSAHEVKLLPSTAARASQATSEPIDFEVAETLLCLGESPSVYRSQAK